MRLRPLLLASALLVLAAPLANAARMTPALRGDLLTLPAAQRYVAFASFAPTVTPQQRLAIAQQHGLHVVHDFAPNARSLFLSGTVGQFQALALEAEVSFMEENTRIPLLDATHGWPTRVRVAHEPVSGGPYYDAQGRTLRGQGVGAAIVDSGVNGLQGDFDDNMVRNFKVTCNILGAEVDSDTCVFTDVGVNGTSDSTGGHGTHVAGITLGGGQRSDIGYPASAMPAIPGTYSGIAPDAGLYAFGSGETLFVLNYTAAASFDWIIKNNPTLEVPVRVINNSYGGAGPYEADAVVSQLTLTAVQNNISVIFAAGNDAGGGAADSQTSSYCRDPNPGVVCVASYNDAGTGTQKGLLSSFTSKGKLGEHGDYPDIAAPGDTITSACTQVQPGQAVCATGAETTWQPFYGTISGTSMAAPHVAGALALIYQARPELTPAQAEKLLKDTAIKVATNGEYETDPSNPGGTHNFGFGAGLMDLPAALDSLGVRKQGFGTAGSEELIVDADADDGIDGASNVLSLTMQEATVDGNTGITYRITLVDATEFLISSTNNIRLEQNVNGEAFSTTVQLSPDGLSTPEAGVGNTAVAANAVLDGNVVSFFLPYFQLGYPPVGAPIHNLRVVTADVDAGDQDYAPSPAGVPAALAASMPAYGKPFTVRLPAGLPPASNEKSCVAPGLTVLTAPAGLTGNGLPTGQDDLRQAWIAEPETMPGKLVFTIKVDNLTAVPPNYRWYFYFIVPGNETRYFAAMDTATGPLPSFIFGTTSTIDNPAAPLGAFTVLGDLDAASSFNADGTITLVVDKASFETPISTGMELSGIAVSIRQTTNPENGVGLTVDSSGGLAYTVVDNVCPKLTVTPPVVEAPPVIKEAEDVGRFGTSALGLLVLLPLFGAALRRRRA